MLTRRLLATVAALVLSTAAAFADTASKAVDAAEAPISSWPGPASAVNAPKGKTVFVVTCASQGIGCVRAAKGVEEAGAVLGWNVRTIDGRGDPATWNKAIQSAVAAKADGVVLDAVPPMLVGDALQKAAAAKIAVVSVFNPPPAKKDNVFAYVRPDHTEQGRLAADWVAVDSKGAAKVVLVSDPIFPELVERVTGFKEALAKCRGLQDR